MDGLHESPDSLHVEVKRCLTVNRHAVQHRFAEAMYQRKYPQKPQHCVAAHFPSCPPLARRRRRHRGIALPLDAQHRLDLSRLHTCTGSALCMVTLPTPGGCRPRRKMHAAVSGMGMLPMQSAAAGPQGGSRFSCLHRQQLRNAEKHCQQSRTPLRRRRGGCGRRRAGAWAPGWRRRAPTPRSGTPLPWQSRSSGRWSAPAAPGDAAFATFKMDSSYRRWTPVSDVDSRFASTAVARQASALVETGIANAQGTKKPHRAGEHDVGRGSHLLRSLQAVQAGRVLRRSGAFRHRRLCVLLDLPLLLALAGEDAVEAAQAGDSRVSTVC